MINQLTDTQLKATTGGALPPTEFQFEAMHAAREMGGFATNQERLAWINNYISVGIVKLLVSENKNHGTHAIQVYLYNKVK